MIKIIIQGIYQFIDDNNVRKDDIKIYLHPIVKRHLENDIYRTYHNYSITPNNEISIIGVKVRTGYDLENIVIASPSLYNIQPLVINLKELTIKY